MKFLLEAWQFANKMIIWATNPTLGIGELSRKPYNVTTMKKQLLPILLVLCTIISLGFYSLKQHQTMSKVEPSDYDKAWKIVDSLEQQGLPESALKQVVAIVTRAKRDKNAPQLVKSLLYRGKFQSQLEEDGLVKAIQRMEGEITEATSPVKPILQSIQAELLTRYLRNNQWKLRDRTEVKDFELSDIQTWSIPQLIEQSRVLYLASIADASTKKVAIQDFEIITKEGANASALRPTLFDLLAHRAVDHFKNDRNRLTEPAYKFYINQPEAFAPAKDFATATFETKDKKAAKYQTLLVLQDLLSTHLQSNNTLALVDADLKRLKFVYDNAVLGNKEALYISALGDLVEAYKDEEVYTEIVFQLASIYQRKGQQYRPNPDQKGKLAYSKAYQLCEAAIAKFPNSYGAKQCQNIIASITRKHIDLKTEQVNIPNEPILAAITFQNIEQAYVKVVRLGYEEQQALNRENRETVLKKLNAKEVIRTQAFKLPQEGDFHQHIAELDLGELPTGTYAVMVSDSEAFSDKGHAVGHAFFHVSNIAFWSKSGDDGKAQLVVVDRTTGDPIKGVIAELYAREYNALSRKNVFKKIATQQSDKDGFIAPDIKENVHFQVKLIHGEDVLYLDDAFSNYRHRDYQGPANVHTHFFLDRAIYRPGQTVHFKGIVIQKEVKGMPAIKANEKVVVSFLDVNRQEVGTKELTTNEYGTITGTFTAPKTGLLGQMSLTSSAGGSHYFSIEEYKRPKFEVTFDPIKEAYKLEDTVVLKGKALAFAGNSIDGSKVTYRVVRQVRFPYRPYWWGRYNPYQQPEQEITNGETTTNTDGSFEISFAALPDLAVPAAQKPEFTYRVLADIIDITGETQSADTRIKVGYVSLSIALPLANKIELTEDTDLKISSKNLAGEFAAAKGKIVIESLAIPGSAFKKRLWDQPDTYILSEADFKKKFSDIAYKTEDKKENWKVLKKVEEISFNTTEKKRLVLPVKELGVGQYRLTLNTEDKDGTPIEIVKYFEIYDLKKKEIATNQTEWLQHPSTTFEPGEEASVYIGSALVPIQVLVEIEKQGKIVKRYWEKVKGLEKIDFPVLESDRGNFHYHLTFTKNNRPYKVSKTILVPWANKDLTIEYATFRDKLLPGQEEEWRIKISGPKKEKIAAEMVAGMYDASLDQFSVNDWLLNIYPTDVHPRYVWQARGFRAQSTRLWSNNWQPEYTDSQHRIYPSLEWFGFSGYGRSYGYSRGNRRMAVQSKAMPQDMAMESMAVGAAAPVATARGEAKEAAMADTMEEADGLFGGDAGAGNVGDQWMGTDETSTQNTKQPIRTNLKETVFFLPNLKTDAEGNIIIKFTMNEALTRWKFLGLAHTKDLKFATTQKEVVTQKELMITPTPPRFFREGDVIAYTAKVSNLSDKALTGSAQIELLDAVTMQPVTNLLGVDKKTVSFTVPAGQSVPLSWNIEVPKGKVNAITHRVTCQAGNYSDGEESAIPVLTNRQLVTESKPLALRAHETKDFTLESLAAAKNSSSLQAHSYSLEFTSNPAWYAVQALPYLMEYPYDCTEQIFSRFYANTLASSVANAHPRIKTIFEEWKGTDSDALKSNLSKNQELKSALLTETPWVLAAQSEEEQKRNIGLLFDLTRMGEEQVAALNKIKERQLSNGGSSWFPGGRDSWYITQHLVEGMGHLKKLNAFDTSAESDMDQVLANAIQYIDARAVEAYEELKKRKGVKMSEDHLTNLMVHYLYTRSFFQDAPLSADTKKVHDYYVGQAEKYWLNKGIYQEGMIGLALNRIKPSSITSDITKSLKERALKSDELGMYWKQSNGYLWHQLPMETHAIMIELFQEVAKDQEAVNELKIWLLKNKQTNHWKTTKATSSVVYALLMAGDNWLVDTKQVDIELGNNNQYQAQITSAQSSPEAGTGYFKTTWTGDDISPDMATIKVSNPNDQPVWGAVYWQYFEDLDKIKTFEETPLTIKKQSFKEVNSDTGPKLTAISETSPISPGDKIKVRIEIRVDRAMEYVHLKDTRAAGFEPINVLSGYKWQGGLGYYESTGDVATNFFMDHLPKGTFVFEYPLRVVHKGEFSNGITSMQCMYAPEFSSHSEGIRVKVK